jgi:hypothetical protein
MIPIGIKNEPRWITDELRGINFDRNSSEVEWCYSQSHAHSMPESVLYLIPTMKIEVFNSDVSSPPNRIHPPWRRKNGKCRSFLASAEPRDAC